MKDVMDTFDYSPPPPAVISNITAPRPTHQYLHPESALLRSVHGVKGGSLLEHRFLWYGFL
jgi:hypothetical protein